MRGELIHKTDISSELETLHEELLDAQKRLRLAAYEDKSVIAKQIMQIERDISRYSAKNRD